jgi:tetratricopeptide (TPR) repeat protein
VDVEAALARGRALIDSGKFALAVETLQPLAETNPTFADVHNLLGVALSLCGEARRAEIHLQRAVALNPDFAEAHLNLALLLFERGAYESGRGHLQRFDRAARGADRQAAETAVHDLVKRHVDLARRYRAHGMLAEAEEQLHAALRLRPRYADVQLELARVLFERAKFDESAACVESLLRERPRYDAALLLGGEIARQRGQLQAARDAWRRVRRGSAAVQARAFLEAIDAEAASARSRPPEARREGLS